MNSKIINVVNIILHASAWLLFAFVYSNYYMVILAISATSTALSVAMRD